ncbi:MAG: type II CRISPR RNA-guided endonuclease Cas9 [Pseudomonadota bacterium]
MKRKSVPWRLGLDLGTNSIGWCVFDLSKPDRDGRRHPIAIRRTGVRIFPDGRDPQSGASLAASRREPRSARRRRDRFLMRRATLLHALIRHGLMPADPAARRELESLDPWKLRAEGLDRALTPHEFGRVLFHLNQRRGFLSNRKADRKAKSDEKQGMKAGQKKLEEAIAAHSPRGPDAKAWTLGKFLYWYGRENRSPRGGGKESERGIRFRARIGQGGKAEWDFYPTRAMLHHEFDALWEEQAKYHAGLTEDARSEIARIIFHQRPLKPVDPGPCTFEENDKRAPLALPIVQEFRILQELSNLELVRKTNPTDRRRLTMEQRDKLLEQLLIKEKVTFKRMRALLGIEAIWTFNLESEKRKDLKGDRTSYLLSKPEAFGARWFAFSDEERNRIVEWLLDIEDEAALIAKLSAEFDLTPEQAEHIANAPLEDGYGRLGRIALAKIVPELRTGRSADGGPLRYSEAVQRAGYLHHSDFRDGEILDLLPYYGDVLRRYIAPVSSLTAPEEERRFGRIANPTVHIGLNQLRRLINALVERYGHPEEIVVELARDLKLSQEEKERIEKEQAENQKKNEMRRAKLAEVFPPGQKPPGDAMLRLRLWEELNPEDPNDRKCVYTGKQISIQRLFSPEVEIEHILPFTKSLDDNPSNLTVSIRHANRDKGNLTPFEAFGHNPTVGGFKYEWDGIVLRASALPKGKQWRFRPDALDLVKDRARRAVEAAKGTLNKEDMDDIDRTGGFLARQLIDTAYLARVTRQYLWKICDPDKTWVIPGTMTALLRRKWGLNGLLSDHNLKNRSDHRHHAIDAFVVGLTDRSMLQAIAGAADEQRERVIDDMPDPIDWPSFRDDLRTALDRIVVSYKPEHGVQGRLHEETAYGLIKNPGRENGATLIYRKAIADLNSNEIERVRDPKLRRALQQVAKPVANDKPKLKAALAKFAAEHKPPLRRVRLTKVEKTFETIRDDNGRPFKALTPGENHHVDIVELPDGEWIGIGVTVFAANRSSGIAPWQVEHPDSHLVMRVHKGDLLRLEADGGERIYRVVKLAPGNGRLVLAGQYEGGNFEQRHKDEADPFRWLFVSFNQLKARKARKVSVDVLGRVRDPGPPK